MKNLTIEVILKAVDAMSGVVNSAVNNTVTKFAQLDSRLHKATLATQRVGQDAAMVAIGMGAPALHAIKQFSDMETSALRLKAALMTNDGVSPLFAKVNEEAMRLGAIYPGNTAKMADMITTLITNGKQAEDVLAGLGEATVRFAVVSHQDFNDAAQMFARLSNTLGIAREDYLEFADVLQRGFYLGASAEELRYGIGRAGGALKALNMQGLEASKGVVALTTLLIRLGLTGEVAGTNTAAMYNNLMDAKKIGKANDYLKQFGISLNFVNEQGSFIGQEGLIQQLMKLSPLTMQQRIAALREMFGGGMDQQIASMLASQGMEGWLNILDQMRNQATLAERNKEIIKGLKNHWDTFTGNLENLEYRVVNTFSDDLKALFASLSRWIDRIGDWVEGNKEFVAGIGKAFLAVTAFMGVIAAVGIPLSLFLRGLHAVTTASSALAMSLGWAAKLDPTLKAVAVVGTEAAASAVKVGLLANAFRFLLGSTPTGMLLRIAAFEGLSWVWDKVGRDAWDNFMAGFSGQQAEALREMQSTLAESMRSVVPTMPQWNMLTPQQQQPWNMLTPTPIPQSIDMTAIQAQREDASWFTRKGREMSEWWAQTQASMKKSFSLFVRETQDLASGIWSVFSAVFERIGRGAVNLWSILSSTWNGFKQVVGDTVDALTAVGTKMVDTVTGWINACEQMKAAWTRYTAYVVEWWSSTISKIIEGFKSLPGKIGSVLQGLMPMALSLSSGWGSVGQAMATNLSKGFAASMGAAKASMASMATSATPRIQMAPGGASGGSARALRTALPAAPRMITPRMVSPTMTRGQRVTRNQDFHYTANVNVAGGGDAGEIRSAVMAAFRDMERKNRLSLGYSAA